MSVSVVDGPLLRRSTIDGRDDGDDDDLSLDDEHDVDLEDFEEDEVDDPDDDEDLEPDD